MGHLILSHLSKNNNNPQLVKDLFEKHAAGTKITVASRFEETPVFEITDTYNYVPVAKKAKPYLRNRPNTLQLSLFQ